MKPFSALVVSFTAVLITLSLFQSVVAASPKQKKLSQAWQNVERVSIQPEGIKFPKTSYDGIPEGYTLGVSDPAMARRLFSALRQNRRLSYSDNQIKAQGLNPEPPQLEIALRINGFYRTWWRLQLVKKQSCYPLQFQHNSQQKNELQLSYATVSTSQLQAFLHLIQIASSRARHKQTGYAFDLVQGI